MYLYHFNARIVSEHLSESICSKWNRLASESLASTYILSQAHTSPVRDMHPQSETYYPQSGKYIPSQAHISQSGTYIPSQGHASLVRDIYSGLYWPRVGLSSEVIPGMLLWTVVVCTVYWMYLLMKGRNYSGNRLRWHNRYHVFM